MRAATSSHRCGRAAGSERAGYTSNVSAVKLLANRPLGTSVVQGRLPRQMTCGGRPVQAWATAPAESTYVFSGAPKNTEDGPVIVWFKHDLRLDDHPGLQQALASGKAIIPVYCFDPKNYTQLLRTSFGLEALCTAVARLSERLQAAGSGLVVRCGDASMVLPALAEFVGASEVITEDEVEARWLRGMESVEAALPEGVRLRCWTLHMFGGGPPYPSNYREFVKSHSSGELLEPIEPPSQLPPLPEEVDAGSMPTVHSIMRQAAAYDVSLLQPELLPVASSLSSVSSSMEEDDEAGAEGIVQQQRQNVRQAGAEARSWPCGLHGGEAGVQGALDAYLRYHEPGSEYGHESLFQVVSTTEGPATRGGSFRAVFTPALQLGVLSRRRAYQRAVQQEGGRLRLAQVPGRDRSLKPWETVQKSCEAWDYYWQVALEDRVRPTQAGVPTRHWRWQGVLTDYLEAGPSTSGDVSSGGRTSSSGEAKPAILLVHGFGAFGEHWRDQIRGLAAAGYRVYAPTFPGYGRSEKPPMRYGQDLWRDFLRDFVVEVVKGPVVVAGNSIGGFISASLAADYPPLVKGLILVNSAGQVDPSYVAPTQPAAVRRPPPPWAVDFLSWALFSFLERSIAKQLARLYPTNPKRADEWLSGEIFRAACDPGALGVFRSVFYLPPPRPVNYLVSQLYRGPTLVLQGALDPLNDAKGRAQQLQQCCPDNLRVHLLQAGHCPMDEVPEEFNAEVVRFVENDVLKQQQEEGNIPAHQQQQQLQSPVEGQASLAAAPGAAA